MRDLSFQAKEARASPKRRLDGRLSRTSSSEKEPAGDSESKKESDENKENRRLDEYLNDQDSWNESVISGRSMVYFPKCVMEYVFSEPSSLPLMWVLGAQSPAINMSTGNQ